MRVFRVPAQAVPLIIGLFAIPALSQGLESKRFPHDIAERQRYSAIVCSATILKISKAGNPIKVEGEESVANGLPQRRLTAFSKEPSIRALLNSSTTIFQGKMPR
jgi:hypothetical protein